MKANPTKLLSALGFATCLAVAGAAYAVPFGGTPSNDALGGPQTQPIPSFGTLIDFDDQATGTVVGAGDYASLGVTISLVTPCGPLTRFTGSQSAPNYIGTGGGCGWDGTVQFAFASPTSMVGIGIADSIGPDVLNIYDSGGTLLESLLAPTGANVYVGFSRASADIAMLEVVMDFAALDDLQFIPEPSSVLLMALGLLGLFGGWRRSRAA